MYPNTPRAFSAHSECWSPQADKVKRPTYLPVSTPHCTCGHLSGFEHMPTGVNMFLPQILCTCCSFKSVAVLLWTDMWYILLLLWGCCLLLMCDCPIKVFHDHPIQQHLPCWSGCHVLTVSLPSLFFFHLVFYSYFLLFPMLYNVLCLFSFSLHQEVSSNRDLS